MHRNSKTRHRETVKPTSTLRLMEQVGTSQAARLLGVSTTLLHTARNTQQVSKVVEVAAASLLEEKNEAPAPEVKSELYLIAATPAQREMVERVAKVLGVDLLAA